MNEKGFATILGLCLLLAIALVVKGIQESEGNHSYETIDFQTEIDLQKAAEVGIYMAVAQVKKNPLPLNDVYEQANIYRKKFQEKGKVVNGKEIKTSSGSIFVDVWGERIVLKPYKEVDYKNKTASWTGETKLAYSFFSRAKLTSSRTGGKLYRRAFGYVLQDDSTWTVHFMNVTAGGYTYKD